MRVLLLNDYGTPTGGAEFQAIALRDCLRARGHDARLFASRARYVAGESVAEYHCAGSTTRAQPLLMAFNPSAYINLRRALREFKPDIVHVNMFMWQLSPSILPLLRPFPSVHHVQMYNSICPLGTKLLPNGERCMVRAGIACHRNRCFSWQAWLAVMLQRKLWRRWMGAFDRIVAISETVRLKLEAEGIPVSDVVFNGVPETSCDSRQLANRPKVVFAGRLVKEKGADVLLRAFALVRAMLPNAKLIIAGHGVERSRLEDLARELGLQDAVRFVGHLDRAKLDQQFADAWVQVVPGRWEEPFGIVTTEAMMRSTAVVASEIGCSTELVLDGETGLLASPGDPDSLAAALIELLSDRGLCDRYGIRGREVALERFSETTFVERFLRIYREVIGNRRGRMNAGEL